MSVLSGIAGRLPRGRRSTSVGAPRSRWLNVVLAATVGGLAAGAYYVVTSSPSTSSTLGSVRTAPVTRGVVLSSVSATGSVEPATQLAVSFQASGTLTDVAVKAGQHVRAGQILGRLDAATASTAVQQAEAALKTAQANLEQTLTGETAAQRAADALSLRQARSQITTAEASVTTAKRQLAQDAAAALTSIGQAERQYRADLGNEHAAVAQLQKDLGTYANLAAAEQAVTAAQAVVTGDQVRQHTDQLQQGSLQTLQTQWNQQLTTDKAANNDAGAANDQATLNSLALQLQAIGQTLSNDSYQLSQDQTAASTAQSVVNAVKADQSSIQSYESRIVTDRSSIATAKTNRDNTAVKDDQGIQQAEQSVASAKLSYTSSVLNTEIKQAPATPAALAQQQASVLQAKANLASAEKTLAQTTLRAPVAGVVAAVNGTVGGAVSGGGTSSSASSASSSSTGSGTGTGSSSSSSGFVTLIGLTGMQVTAAFSESDIAGIAVGQPATVTVSALPAEELAAHVVGVDTLGSTSSGVVDYTVTFALDRTEPKLKPGMSANVSVTVAERDNVLNVPSAAVTGSGSNATVKVDTNGVQTTVPVVAGLKGDTATEIVSGLKAGQEVVTSTGATLFSSGSSLTGTTSTSTRRGGFGGAGFPGGFGGGFGG